MALCLLLLEEKIKTFQSGGKKKPQIMLLPHPKPSIDRKKNPNSLLWLTDSRIFWSLPTSPLDLPSLPPCLPLSCSLNTLSTFRPQGFRTCFSGPKRFSRGPSCPACLKSFSAPRHCFSPSLPDCLHGTCNSEVIFVFFFSSPI